MTFSRLWTIPAAAALLASACAHGPAPLVADACQLARAAAQAKPVLRVPFELVDGRIYVQAKVNGRGPYRFAVDTGASGMGRADATLVADLGLKLSGEASNSDGVRSASTQTTRLDSVAIGGFVRRDLAVITRDYNAGKPAEQHFAGILGREFFGDGLLVIDYPHKQLTYGTAVGLAPDATGSIGYERPFRVPVSIGSLRTTGHLDTGANVTAVLPKPLFDGISAGDLQQAETGGLANGKIEIRRAVLKDPMEIGGVRLENLEVRVSDKFPELVIGAHVLQHYMLAIDQRSQRIALCE